MDLTDNSLFECFIECGSTFSVHAVALINQLLSRKFTIDFALRSSLIERLLDPKNQYSSDATIVPMHFYEKSFSQLEAVIAESENSLKFAQLTSAWTAFEFDKFDKLRDRVCNIVAVSGTPNVVEFFKKWFAEAFERGMEMIVIGMYVGNAFVCFYVLESFEIVKKTYSLVESMTNEWNYALDVSAPFPKLCLESVSRADHHGLFLLTFLLKCRNFYITARFK